MKLVKPGKFNENKICVHCGAMFTLQPGDCFTCENVFNGKTFLEACCKCIYCYEITPVTITDFKEKLKLPTKKDWDSIEDDKAYCRSMSENC